MLATATDGGVVSAGALSAGAALRSHWPEYLIEAWALGTFMVSAGFVATLLGYPGSPVHASVHSQGLRMLLGGAAMGLTAMALVYSPWGKRSGAHMNPAITLTFLRLGRVKPWDALFYVAAQFIGGTLGVLLVWAFLGAAFADPPVAFAATVPGPSGVWVALGAEFAISFGMMLMILVATSHARLARLTGVFAGVLVAAYITLESPLSGMSMNPARTFASAAPGGSLSTLWLYCVAPLVGMLSASLAFCAWRGRDAVACAKLDHAPTQRCIHCGYQP